MRKINHERHQRLYGGGKNWRLAIHEESNDLLFLENNIQLF